MLFWAKHGRHMRFQRFSAFWGIAPRHSSTVLFRWPEYPGNVNLWYLGLSD